MKRILKAGRAQTNASFEGDRALLVHWPLCGAVAVPSRKALYVLNVRLGTDGEP